MSTQCTFANIVLTETACCNSAHQHLCDVPKQMDDVLKKIDHYQSDAINHISTTEVVSEIDNSQPVCIQKTWDQGAYSHFLLIFGYSEDGDFVDILDPASPTGTIQTYESCHMPGDISSSTKEDGLWEYTFYTAKNP